MSEIINAFKKYGVGLSDLETNGVVFFIGTLPSKDNAKLTNELCQNVKTLVHFSPIEDETLSQKADKYIKYEIGSEAGLLALIAKSVLKDENLPNDAKRYIEELDEGYLSAESNVGEEEIDEILGFNGDIHFALGNDVKEHPDIDAIAGVLALICRFKNARVSLFEGGELEKQEIFLPPPKIDNIKSFDGLAVYFYPSQSDIEKIYGSPQFAIAAKIKNQDEVVIRTNNQEYKRVFEIDHKLKGSIALLGVKNHNGFRYGIADIKKAENV
jgi:NADH-quinone oxidoreductase subunit F